MITQTVGELRRALADPRFNDDQQILCRIVDPSQHDELHHGAYYAIEAPIFGGLTGWQDGHATILVQAQLPEKS